LAEQGIFENGDRRDAHHRNHRRAREPSLIEAREVVWRDETDVANQRCCDEHVLVLKSIASQPSNPSCGGSARPLATNRANALGKNKNPIENTVITMNKAEISALARANARRAVRGYGSNGSTLARTGMSSKSRLNVEPTAAA
jgi:hypothetical protein